MRNEVAINIRAHSSLVALIDKAADVEGKTRSAFIRDCAIAEALKVFERPKVICQPCPICGHVA